MSRPLRIEFSDAWYHVLSRGRRRESIVRSTKDYEIFLQTVQEACEFWHLRVDHLMSTIQMSQEHT
jgi:putative transposase